jgi:hypothetical protein
VGTRLTVEGDAWPTFTPARGSRSPRLLQAVVREAVVVAASGRAAHGPKSRGVARGSGVEREVARLAADVPQSLQLKRAELAAEERKIGNFLEFIGEGRGSRTLAEALAPCLEAEW